MSNDHVHPIFKPILAVASERPDEMEIACERCLGTGWRRIPHHIRDEHGIYHDRSDYPDCKRCNGTGVEPRPQGEEPMVELRYLRADWFQHRVIP